MVDTCYGLESAYCSGEECLSDCSENGTTIEEDLLREAVVSKPENKALCYDVDVAVIGERIRHRLKYTVFTLLF